MLEYFLNIFNEVCVDLVGWIPYIVAIYFLVSMVSSLLFKDR